MSAATNSPPPSGPTATSGVPPAVLPASAKTGHQVKRLSAILTAAEEVFLAKGFERGNLDDVAKKAGASKATIYAHFGDKVGLFRAIMANRTDVISTPITQAGITRAAVEDVLRSFGLNFLKTLTSPIALKFYKLIIANGALFPELGRMWFENGPRIVIGKLAAFLRDRTAKGELDIADPDSAAEMFLMSLRGTLHMQALLHMIEPPFDEAIAAKVNASVDMFMKAHRPRAREARHDS